MKKLKLTLLAIVALLGVGCTSAPHHARLMSYNIRNGKGVDDNVSLERIARIINAERVDAVALQEVDSITRRYPIDVAAELATMTDMYATFSGSISFQGGKYGIAVLTREKPISSRRVPLPCRLEPRSLLIVEMKEYYFCSTHLSLNEEDRVASVEIIAKELGQLDKPAILAGDLNAEPMEAPIELLKEHFQLFEKSGPEGPYTWPADEPNIEIDYIALHRAADITADITAHYVVAAPIESDHRPIVAEILLP